MFDGSKIPATVFINAINNFQKYIVPKDTRAFIDLVKYQTTGKGSGHISGKEFKKVDDLIKEIKTAFTPSLILSQYQI